MTDSAELSTEKPPGSRIFAVTLACVANMCAVVSIVLVILIIVAINRGRTVQDSVNRLDADYTKMNMFFDTRADFRAPARARAELHTLSGVLAELNMKTAEDVSILASILPDVRRLIQSGGGDLAIAHQLDGVSQTLLKAGGDLANVAHKANRTVSATAGELARTNRLVGELNNVLGRIAAKLAVLPTVPVRSGAGQLINTPVTPGGR
jgi:hypothetical protein